MSKHTPGPWHFVPENAGLMLDHGYGILYGEPDSWGWEKNLYVSVGCSGNVLRELGEGAAEANARLIAAAPDLLAALKIAEQFMSIAGRRFEEIEIDGEMRDPYELQEIVRAVIAKATGAA